MPESSRLILLFPLVLAGCHPHYRVEQIPTPAVGHPELATICLLRPQSFGALAAFEHVDNGHLMGVTQGGKVYFCYLAQPGVHHLVARSDNEAKATLTVRAGERHFVRLEVGLGPDDLFPTSRREAALLLPGLRYVRTVVVDPNAPPPYPHPAPAVL